jgi:hypothetical protein
MDNVPEFQLKPMVSNAAIQSSVNLEFVPFPKIIAFRACLI